MSSERQSIAVRDELTIRTARGLCDAVDAALAAEPRALTLEVNAVKTVDAVGLAALLQSVQRVEAHGMDCAVIAGGAVYAAALRGRMLDELTLIETTDAEPGVVITADPHAPTRPLAATERVILRQPTWEELPLFERWARDPVIEQMVGSDLLYQSRHLGAYHPDVVAAVLADPTALTVVVEPWDAEGPVGFVRLYGICLPQQFAFLETAMGSTASLRRAWGIDASRLLLAYACDALWIERVEAKVYAYNVLSANSLRRNGFREEGVLREARMYDRQRWDIGVFSILSSEMRAQRTSERFPCMSLWSGAR